MSPKPSPRIRVLGLVPARGGSKGISGKNLKALAGRPLIGYTAEVALAAKSLARVVLSTEDPGIAEVGHRWGLDTPFARPADLAADDTPMLAVVRHALETLEAQGDRYDAVCLLQPTSPLRRPEDVDACVDLLQSSGADAVFTVLPVPPEYNPRWTYLEDGEGWLRLATGETEPVPRRQELPPAWHREGSVYVTRRDVVMEQDSLYGRMVIGYPIEPTRSVNLDEPEDWKRVEAMLGIM